MKPSKKNCVIEEVLEYVTGVDRRKCITGNICTWCGGPAEEFRNDISIKEYTISGFCQKCQDETFGVD
jgi:hypothetical protein